MVLNCKSELETLLKELEKRTKGHRVGWERLKGAFPAKRTLEAVQTLNRQCQVLNNLVGIDALAVSLAIDKNLREMRVEERQRYDSSTKTRRDQELAELRRKILDWITVDHGAYHSDVVSHWQQGTGQWLLDTAEFEEWVDSGGRLHSTILGDSGSRQDHPDVGYHRTSGVTRQQRPSDSVCGRTPVLQLSTSRRAENGEHDRQPAETADRGPPGLARRDEVPLRATREKEEPTISQRALRCATVRSRVVFDVLCRYRCSG